MGLEKKLKKVLSSGKKEVINSFFEEIYNKYKGLVFYVVYKYIDNKDDVKDIVQDVFISFFNNADKLDNNIKSYLTMIARNKALNFINKHNKMNLVDVKDLDLLVEKKQVSYLDEALSLLKKNLKDIEYEILILHIIEDYTFLECSKKLNMKESTIKSVYFRALKKCRLVLEAK